MRCVTNAAAILGLSVVLGATVAATAWLWQVLL